MATIIWLRRKAERPILANIQFETLFDIDTDLLPKLFENWWDQFKTRAEIQIDPNWDEVALVEKELQTIDPKSYIRGKWALCFFLKFILKVQDTLSQKIISEDGRPAADRAKPSMQLNVSSILSFLSGKISTPSRLSHWIKKRLPD